MTGQEVFGQDTDELSSLATKMLRLLRALGASLSTWKILAKVPRPLAYMAKRLEVIARS